MRLLFLFAMAASATWSQVDFATEIHPLLASRCAGCHTGPAAQAGLRVDDRAGFVRVRDKLLPKVRGQAGMRMPPSGEPLTSAQIASLERWVAEEFPWTDVKARAAAAGWEAPLAPRRPALPQSKESNGIDRFVEAYFRSSKIAFRPAVSDEIFVRRVYFDILGIGPSQAQIREFAQEKRADKRSALVDRLLANRTMYAGHWMSFWNDLLRNDSRAYYGETKNYTPWLQKALAGNRPYDGMVRELVNPSGPDAPEGFLIGVNWRGDVNASQLPHMQAAQNTAQVFLGVNLKCASCHDSFVNKYKLRQSYGMAALFADAPQLELVRCDVKTGKMQGPEFLFPSLGTVPQEGTLAERRAVAAALFTSPENGRLARTFVNRVWGRLFGRAIVEPVDDMDARPWDADLLDWLASDFADNGYDIHRLLRLILTSRTWQQTAEPDPPDQKVYMFRGPLPRRLTAEQFVDTLSAITGEWRLMQTDRVARFAREWEFRSTELTRALGRPIRDQVYTTRPSESSTLQALELVNGTTLAQTLRRGAKRLTGSLEAAPQPLYDSKTMRRGTKEIDIAVAGMKEVWLLVEDVGSYDVERTVAGWSRLEIDGAAARPTDRFPAKSAKVESTEYPDLLQIPFAKAVYIPVPDGAKRLTGKAVIDDIGRLSEVNSAVRFYVFPKQPDRNLLVGVTEPPPVPAPGTESAAGRLCDRLFWETLGRAPSPAEKQLALATMQTGGRVSAAGLEDVLWVLLLHPEFQYAH